MIYMDYAATSPMTRNSLEAYVEVAQRYYGNSASLHDLGDKPFILSSSQEML